MSKILAYLIAFLITFPTVITIITYFGLNYIFKNKRFAVHKCMEYTAVFHLVSAIITSNVILNIQLLGLVFILLLVIFLVFILIQWTVIRDIKIRRLWKLYLRFVFLLAFFANIILVVVSIYRLI